MKIRAAVIRQMGLPQPYAQSRPMSIEQVDVDPPGEREVLVKVKAAGLCHSDLSTVNADRPRPMPMVLGHEAAGEVVEIGPGVHDLQVADHVDHIRKVAGIDHVGLGGDFDGISSVVLGLEDVSTYPMLVAELLRRGWSDDDVKKLAGRNILRVSRRNADRGERCAHRDVAASGRAKRACETFHGPLIPSM